MKILWLSFLLICGAIVFTHDARPTNQSNNLAWGQTGPTGPTGPTGATGSGGATYNGHTIFSGSAPAITVCGTTPTIPSTSTDNAGTITVGAATKDSYGHVIPVTSCTVTFATAFTFAPAVTLSTNQAGLGITVNAVSTTVLIVQFSRDASTRVFKYTAF